MRVENNASYGTYVGGNSDVISGNYLLGNGYGIVLLDGSSDQATSNWIESNTQYGLIVESVTGMTVSSNKALNTAGTGFGIIAEGDTGSLSGNVANGNAADGIFLDNPGTGVKPGVTATGNRAAFNTGLGIDSAPGGSVDGGNNVVQDNGTSAQCANIVCHEVST
jgi:Right handed beta helix region